MRTPRLPSSLALALALAVIASGCRIRDRDESDPPAEEELSAAEQEVVSDATELDEAAQDGSAIAAIPSLPLLLGDGAPTLARAVELQKVGARLFVPLGCAAATAEGNVVTYEFDGCTGPAGLAELDGREVATFRPGPTVGSIAIAMQSEELTLGGRAIEHVADVTVAFVEGGKLVTWTGSFTGTTRRGLPFEHTSSLALDIDAEARCSTLDGTTSGSVGGRGLDTTYTELLTCAPRGTCPAGRIESTGRVRGLTVAIEFDGSSTAIVTTPRGAEIDVELACAPMGGGS